MPTVPKRQAQTVGPSAPQTRAASTVFQDVRGATADAFGAAEGRALAGVSAALGGEAERLTRTANKRLKAEAQLQNRREAVDRADIITDFSTTGEQVFTTAKAQTDLSKEAPLVALGLTIGDLRTKALTQFQGSDLGRLILDERLSTIEGQLIGRASKEAALIGLAKVEAVVGGYINTARSTVTFAPETLDEQIAATLKLAQEDFGAFSPQQELEFSRAIPASLANAAITSHIIQGKFDKAEALMRRPDLAAAIGETRLLQLSKQIGEARAADAKARAEVRSRDVKGIPREVFDAQSPEVQQQILGVEEEKDARILTEAETLAAGFAPGTVVQDRGGEKFEVLQKPGDSQKDIEKEAFDKEKGKLKARRENIQSILAAAGAPPLPSEDLPVLAKTEGGEAAPESEALQNMMAHFTAARNLFAGGASQQGRDQLALATFIAKNSPDLIASQELDKPLSAEALQLFGLPAGATMRDAMGRIPPSIGEEAEQRAEGAATGTGRVKAKLDIAFIDQATDLIQDFQQAIELDPTIVGALGGLRARGQTITSVLKDFGLTSIVDSAKNIALTQSDATPEQFDGWFDNPKLSVLKVFENSVGLILARSRSEGSRILASVIERSIDDVNLTKGGSDQVPRRLNFVLNVLAAKKRGIANVFGVDLDEVPVTLATPDFQVKDGKFGPFEGPK